MEGLLDVPLRDVRIFRGQASRRVTRDLQADAVTSGDEVHVAPHYGTPGTPSGDAIIAHELSHVAARRATPSAVAAEAEEQRAQAIEHAVRRRSESPAPQPPARTAAAPQLTHRLAAAPAPKSAAPSRTSSLLQSPASSGPGLSFPAGPAVSPAAPGVIARAPSNRLPPMGDSFGRGETFPQGGDPLLDQSKPNPYSAPDGQERDEAGLIERVVEAVLRRVRRDSLLDRERRGVFRSEIGG
jgi:hypothetical protein